MGASMGSRVQSVLRGFTPAHLVVDGFILVRCPERLAFIGIIGFTVERLGFVGFIRVRVGSPGGGGGIRFALVHSVAPRVHRFIWLHVGSLGRM